MEFPFVANANEPFVVELDGRPYRLIVQQATVFETPEQLEKAATRALFHLDEPYFFKNDRVE